MPDNQGYSQSSSFQSLLKLYPQQILKPICQQSKRLGVPEFSINTQKMNLMKGQMHQLKEIKLVFFKKKISLLCRFPNLY